jgi:glutamyl/glutaminyl-tRNA synthetase
VHWLGYDWGKNLYLASDYFEQLYTWTKDLIRAGMSTRSRLPSIVFIAERKIRRR